MNCNKLLITLLLILAVLPSSAQLLPFSLEVRGGLNRSKPSIKDAQSIKALYSYRADAVLDFKMGLGFFTRTGLTLTEKNMKREYRDESICINTKINAQYLQVPVMVGYKLGIPMLGSINVAGGMYFSYGIGGKAKDKRGFVNYTPGGDTLDEREYKTNTFANAYRRFDTGIAISAGIEVKRITFNLGYEHGLLDVYNDNENVNYNKNIKEIKKIKDIKNRSIYATIGFRIL